jgi:hypothetical protein
MLQERTLCTTVGMAVAHRVRSYEKPRKGACPQSPLRDDAGAFSECTTGGATALW